MLTPRQHFASGLALPGSDAPRRLLVVEDDDDSLYTLVTQLSLAGYEDLAVARDGDAAIAALQQGPVDLVLLDLMMPGRDGFGVLEWVRTRDALAHVPVIVISALDTPEAIVRSIKLGAADFLPKPIKADQLQARIRANLTRAHLPHPLPLDGATPASPDELDPALLQRTLESLSVAGLVVEAGGKVRAANSHAAALAGDGLRQEDGYLKAEDPESQRALLLLIEAALQGGASTKAIALRRPSRRMPLLVRAVAPTGGLPRILPSCALLLVADPETGTLPQVSEELTLLGLTPGESRVAALVGCGHSPRDTAAKLGIAEETTRTVLKRVYEKLQIRRQGELAAFVAQIALISSR